MSDGGKGSAPRPIPDRKTFESNWDRIFGKQVEPGYSGVTTGVTDVTYEKFDTSTESPPMKTNTHL